MSTFESSAFLRRFRNNTEQSARPVPGQIRISRGVSDEVKDGSAKAATEKPVAAASPKSSVVSDLMKSSTEPTQEKEKYVSTYRTSQFEKLLAIENVNLASLRTLAWNGVPSKYRADVWQMLLGYLPTNRDRRAAALDRKRKEYFESISMYFAVADIDRTKQDEENLSQISIDLPRTSPNVAFFQQNVVQDAMKRILYIWSIRHPASGYVQGMNDLLTPLLLVSLQPFVEDPLRCDVAALESGIMVSIYIASCVRCCICLWKAGFSCHLSSILSFFVLFPYGLLWIYLILSYYFLTSRRKWKQMPIGVSRSCSTTFKTTIPSASRDYSA